VAAGGQLPERLRAREGAHFVPAGGQQGDQGAAEPTGRSGHQDATGSSQGIGGVYHAESEYQVAAD
jgi:hypothetical protein